MIFLKTEDEIELLRKSNLLVGKTLAEIAKVIKPGVTTKELDRVAEEFIRDNGAVPTFKGFPNQYGDPFPASICTSVNDQVVHGILLVQAPSYLLNLKMQAGPSLNASLDWTLFMFTSTIILAAGSMFILWLGERITDKGIGNGISLIIMIGIIARLPQSLFQELISRMTDKTGGLVMFLIELVVLLVVIAFAILLVQGTRKIPVQYAKKIVGNKQYGGARQYIPLKVNAANVMPIIFAQAIMFIPITLVGFSNVNDASGFVRALTDHTSFWYNLIFAVLIILFTYFYTAITINPTQMAEDMKRNNGFIPGIKPGKQTAEYIDVIMSRITLPGSFFLALVAIMPAFAGIFGVKAEFAQFFGGTSLLILVGVVLDTLQQVESHLLMRHYDGLLKSGRIKGRSGNVAAY